MLENGRGCLRTAGDGRQQANYASDFPDELAGNSIDSLGSGYLHPISELSDCDSTSALSSALLEGRDGYSKGSGYYCGLADPCLWFLSSIGAKAFIYFIS